MKDSHLYQRLTDNYGYKALINMIKSQPLDIAREAFDNITKEAEDHPRYKMIKDTWEQRSKIQ